VLFEIYFTDEDITDYRSTLKADKAKLTRFVALLRERGIFRGASKFYLSIVHDERDVNPYYVSTGLRESLEPEALPEVTLRDAAKVEVHDAPGDVIVFRGSSIWHLRRRSAGTVILYLKMNDFDSDPLGEDPSTATRREETARALCANGEYFAASVVVLARRFDSVQHNHGRGGLELRAAVVAGEPPVPLSDAEAAVLRAVDGHTPCAVLTTRTEGFDAGAAQQAIRRLAARGVLDLLSPPPRGAAR